jgi:WD40 repeat protein
MLAIKKIANFVGHQGSIFALAQGRSPQHFLSAAGDGWVVEWDFQKPELGRVIAKVDTQLFSMATIGDAFRAVVGDMNGGVHWLDFSDVNATRDIAHHSKGTFSILEIGNVIFTAGGDGILSSWDTQTMRSMASFQLSNFSLRVLAHSIERQEIAVGTSDRYIYILDSQSLEIKTRIESAHNNSVFALAYSPCGRYLMSGGRDAQLKVWDLENGLNCISAQSAHWYTINDIVFHPSRKIFATASRDKTIRLWHSETFELLKSIDTIHHGCHINSVNRLLWLPDGKHLISCSDDRSVMAWEIGE